MTRCLSDKALMTVIAELGSTADHAHLAACAACAARRQEVRAEVDRIRQVLLTTPEPAARVVPRRRRSLVALAGLGAAAIAGLVWVEVVAWRTIQPVEDLTSAQVEAALADVTAAIFSVDGEPGAVPGEGVTPARLDQDQGEVGCGEAGRLDETECVDAGQMGAELPDSIDFDMDSAERTVLDTDGIDQGG
jgi:hypothetical protein